MLGQQIHASRVGIVANCAGGKDTFKREPVQTSNIKPIITLFVVQARKRSELWEEKSLSEASLQRDFHVHLSKHFLLKIHCLFYTFNVPYTQSMSSMSHIHNLCPQCPSSYITNVLNVPHHT